MCDWSSDVFSSDLFRDNYLINRVKLNLERGVSEGLYRKDMNMDILSILRINQLDAVFSTQVYPPSRFDMGTVLSELTSHFLYGAVSLKGHRMINEYKGIREDEPIRSEEHTSELQSLMRISYAVFCLKQNIQINK